MIAIKGYIIESKKTDKCLSRYRYVVLLCLMFGLSASISMAANGNYSAAIHYLLLSDSSSVMDCATPQWQNSDFSHVYDIGPGQQYATPNDFPWENLSAGSLIKIHWRNEAYKNKWVVNVAATQQAPVVILGVPNSSGDLPVISGENATTRLSLDYWNESRSLIKIGASSKPANDNAAYITIACLNLTQAKPNYQFTSDTGQVSNYSDNAAAIHIEQGQHISIKNCAIHDAANGIFSTSSTSDIVISGNHIWDNGIFDSIYQHNSYTESLGITFEFNYYGPLCNGCLGNNLKDRSAGTVVRYNWIEDGNRQLDLVESSHNTIINDVRYRNTYVYGNMLLERENTGNRQIVHYGGDGANLTDYRKGTLYFYHNTVYSSRSKNTLLALSSNDETANVRNNIIMGADQAVADSKGVIHLVNNWITTAWVDSHGGFSGTLHSAQLIEGTNPGFINSAGNNFYLDTGSDCINVAQANVLASQNYPLQWEFLKPSNRKSRASLNDLGAFNY